MNKLFSSGVWKSKFSVFLQSRMGFSIVVNSITILVSLVLFRPFFEENDDIGISMLVEGAYGEKEPHLIVSNFFLGKGLVSLQNFWGSIRWHTVLQYFFLFFSFVAFTYVLTAYRKGKILSVIFLLASFYECYVSLQFTKTASIISAIGCLILFYIAETVSETVTSKIVLYSIAFISMVYAILLRTSFFQLVVGFMALYGIMWLLKDTQKIKKRILSCFIMLLPILLMMFIFDSINKRAYASYSEWSGYLEYNHVRSGLVDRHMSALDYDNNGKMLEKLGISENDANMYITWQIADDTVLSKEKMQEIIDSDTTLSLTNIELLKRWASASYETFFVINPVLISVVILSLVFLFGIVCYKKWNYFFAFLIQWFFLITVLYYFQYIDRWSHRAVYSLMLPELSLLIFVLCKNDFEYSANKREIFCLLGVLLVVALGQRLGNEFEYRKYQRESSGFSSFMDYVQSNKDTLFVVDTFTSANNDKYDVLKPSKENELSNYVTCGGWIMNSPVTRGITEKYGYSNPFEALKKRSENTILVDNCYPLWKQQYCEEHGDGEEYHLLFIDNVGGFDLYKMY